MAVFAGKPAHAQCGGLCLYEVGSLDMAMSAAGASARAEDASTALFNIAGTTRLEGTHILLGTVLGFVDQKLNLDSGTTALGGDGGQVADFVPLGSAFLTTQLYEELRFGFSFTGLYGGSVDYDNNWAGRTWVTESSLAGLNLSPGLAYPEADWLSIGGAVNVTYFMLEYQLKASTALGAPTIEFDDADDWAVSGMVSVLIEPQEDTRIGLNYRTPVNATLSGNIDNPLPANPGFDLDVDLA